VNVAGRSSGLRTGLVTGNRGSGAITLL
jgi:hypothetical protein